MAITRNVNVANCLKRQNMVADKYARRTSLTRAFYVWKAAIKSIHSCILMKYLEFWRSYSRWESIQFELERKGRFLTSLLKRKVIQGFKKFVEYVNISNLVAANYASKILKRNVFRNWCRYTYNLRSIKATIEKMKLFVIFISKGVESHGKRVAFQTLIDHTFIMRKTQVMLYLLHRFLQAIKLESSMILWQYYVRARRESEKIEKHLIRKIIWRWRSLAERSTFWKREDRKALQHWANRLYRIVLISWKDAVKIKWNEKDVANSAHINFSDNKHFIRDYNNIELHPTVLSCGSVVQDSLCEHVDAMGCGINENSNEIIPNLLKLTWDKNELISEVADPLLMMNFDEAKRNCLAPEFTYSKENNADSVLHEHMPKWIVDEITKLEVARERDLRGNFVKDPLRVNSFDADESLSSLKPDFSEYLSMPSEQSKSNIEKKNNFKQDGSEVAYGVEFDLNENDPLSMTMNPLAVKQIHDKLNSLKATLMRANQEKEANRWAYTNTLLYLYSPHTYPRIRTNLIYLMCCFLGNQNL